MDRSRGEPSSVRLQRAGRISVSDFAFGTALRRDYADGHKSPMRVCPSYGFGSRFEESINYQRVFFRGASAITPGRFAAHHGRSGIDSHAFNIGKHNRAAIRNFSRIDSTISGAEAGSIPGGALSRLFAPPVTGHVHKHRFLAGDGARRQKQHNHKTEDQQFHSLKFPRVALGFRLDVSSLTLREGVFVWLPCGCAPIC